MIFVQPLCDNFLTIFSLVFILYSSNECYLNNSLLGQLVEQPKYTNKFRYWHKNQSNRKKVKLDKKKRESKNTM